MALWETTIGAVFDIGFLAVVLGASLLRLRKNHAAEIYVIWYINSFCFVVFFVLGLIAWNGPPLQACGTLEHVCKDIYDFLTNAKSEFLLVGTLTALAILPQMLAYLLSGLSGTATVPKFVRQVHNVAVWSLIKFEAGFGGVITGEFFATLLKASIFQHQWPTFIQFYIGFLTTTLAFVMAALHVSLMEEFPGWRERHSKLLEPLLALHRFLTRYENSRKP
jgi:hypothetical protein